MLKQRMYSFVIYQLSGIQKGIQAGHAWMEYAKNFFQDEDFQQWINNDKTVIILNGGTSNTEGADRYYQNYFTSGIQFIEDQLENLGVKYVEFWEPDLNNTVTAIAFLVNEMVWDQDKYPIIRNRTMTSNEDWDTRIEIELNVNKYGPEFEKSYKLREFLSNYNLASN